MASRKSQQNSAASVIDGYEPLDVIGRGTFGLIRKVRRHADGRIFARKELEFARMSERDRRQIVAEVNILRNLAHDNIVAYVERFVDADAGTLFIIMEYCEGGDLGSVIKRCRKTNTLLPEETVWSYLSQMTLALEACHYKDTPASAGASDSPLHPILHRDLKPENVFLDAESNIKLGDFGLSKQVAAQAFASTYVGTPYYMSPQVASGVPYDCKSDVWALGCIAYELCALAPPFDAANQAELTRKIKLGHVPQLPKGYSEELGDLIRELLSLSPKGRPTTRKLLTHPRVKFAVRTHELATLSRTLTAERQRLRTLATELEERSAEVQAREAAHGQGNGLDAASSSRLGELDAREADVQRREEACGQREAELEETRRDMSERYEAWCAERARIEEEWRRMTEAHMRSAAAAGPSRTDAEERALRRADTSAARVVALPVVRPSMRRISSGGRTAAAAVATTAVGELSVEHIRAGTTGLGTPRATRERQLRQRQREEARRATSSSSGINEHGRSRSRTESEGSEEWVEEAETARATAAAAAAAEATAAATTARRPPVTARRSAGILPSSSSSSTSLAQLAAARQSRRSVVAAATAAARVAGAAPRTWRSADDSDISMRSAGQLSQLPLPGSAPGSSDDDEDKENGAPLLPPSASGLKSKTAASDTDLTRATSHMALAPRPALTTRVTLAGITGEAASASQLPVATYDTQADDDPDLPSPFVRKVTRVPEARLRPSGSAGGSNLLARAAHNYAAVRSAAAAAAAASEAKTDAAAAPAPAAPRPRPSARRQSTLPCVVASALPASGTALSGAPASRIGSSGVRATTSLVPGAAAPRRSFIPAQR